MNTPTRTIDISDNVFLTADILRDENGEIIAKLEDFEAKAAKVPEITNDEESAPWTDLIADMDEFGHKIEERRNFVKDPYDKAVAAANAFFFGLHMPRKGGTPGRLQQARHAVSSAVLAYVSAKEKRARDAAAAEARRLQEQQRLALIKEQEERAKQLAAEEAGRAKAAANAGMRASNAAAAAATAEAEAFEARQQSLSKPADLARTRGDSSLASPAVEWDFEIADIEAVKGAKLWALITRTAKEAAIRKFIANHAPKVQDQDGPEWQPLDGVRIFCRRKLQVRRS